jgi:IS30 family transposase
VEKYSPDAANAQYRKENGGEQVVCTRTLYSYIWNGLFYGLGSEALPRKGKRRTGQRIHHRRVALNNTTGRSIEERTEAINERREEGHWEMDTVVGGPGTKACLLVLTERRNNLELIFKLAEKTQSAVVHLLDRLERKMGAVRFREVFKSITCDNGCENLDAAGMERSAVSHRQRTTVFYAHPYSAYERGANEGANVLIRRFVPKGTDVAALKREDIKRIAHWMNHYPRRKLDYASAFERSPLAPILSDACVI